MTESLPNLSVEQLCLASLLFFVMCLVSHFLRVEVTKTLILGGVRTVVQLLGLGYLLGFIFSQNQPGWVFLLIFAMTLIAAKTAASRSRHSKVGVFSDTLTSVLVSTWTVGLINFLFIVRPTSWYEPRFVIPFVGLLLGNSLTGISLAFDALSTRLHHGVDQIETLLSLGATPLEATLSILKDSLRAGLMPTTNSMTVAGVVSLPGTMTGQILAGASPIEAAKFQILIMLLVASSCFISILLAIFLPLRRMFNHNKQLLHEPEPKAKPTGV